jgi:hypothetical protein
VNRMRTSAVGVVECHFHRVTLGRSENWTWDAGVVVVGLERPDAREFDWSTHRFERVDRMASSLCSHCYFATLFVNVDD